MDAIAEQWPLILVTGYVVGSLVLWLLTEWFIKPSDGENRAAKRERDWYESEFMRQRTVRFFQRARARARAARARRINAAPRWARLPWRLWDESEDDR